MSYVYRAEATRALGLTSDGRIVTGVVLVPHRWTEDDVDVLHEEVQNIGSDVLDYLTADAPLVPGGLYKVVVINESADPETGYIDDYDLKIVPYTRGES